MKTKRIREYIAGNWWTQTNLGTNNSMIKNNHLCMASRTNNHIVLRGQTGFDLKGVLHGKNDIKEQTLTACRCVEELIKEGGGSLKDICKITVYLTERSFIPNALKIIQEKLGGAKPALSIIITGLALKDLLVEIDCDVALGEDEDG